MTDVSCKKIVIPLGNNLIDSKSAIVEEMKKDRRSFCEKILQLFRISE